MTNKQRTVLLVVVVAAIVGLIGYLESQKSHTASKGSDQGQAADVQTVDMTDRIAEKQGKYEVAKEISTPDAFINTEPISVQDFIGKKVILVDFWTYSCINCQRTLPYLNSWQDKYADKGLVILGIHTPEFEFEQDLSNVQKAVEKYGIEYPVILDNDYSTWRAYRNRYWPRKYLIDIDGFIVYDHIGEGGYDETEEKIVELLNERNQVLGENEVVMDTTKPQGVQDVDFDKVSSPETYLGSSRQEYLANLPNPSCLETSCVYERNGDTEVPQFQLVGTWSLSDESAMADKTGATIVIPFQASKVNLVAGANQDTRAKILLDGKPIDSSFAGYSVNDGIVTIMDHDLYNLVDLKGKYEEHVLEIQFLEPGANAFAFTFG